MLDVPTPPGFTSSLTPCRGQEIYALKSVVFDSSRPVMLLVHGAIVSRRYMIPTAQELAPYFNVLVPDLPGHGYSTKPDDAPDVGEQAENLAAWLKELKLSRVHLLANSYGCQIVMELSLRYPEMVESLTLVATVADPEAPTIFEQLMRLLFDGFFERPSLPWLVWRDIFDLGFKRAYQNARYMLDYPLEQKAALIEKPTLVVRGELDPLVSQSWAENIASKISGARFEFIPGAPHGIVYCNAQRLKDIVVRFTGVTEGGA